mmetsp:Transcript_13503/g.43360  ORF Transcript_13503/g.43360 Transcript_13503/m.43360 type:complete len:308 (+) Transcript_13503:90-1013(+)
MAQTLSSCASSVATHSWPLMDQTLTSPSEPEEASSAPPRRKRTFSTLETCPSKVRRQAQSAMDHTLTSMSAEPEAATRSSGAKAAVQTARRWPVRVAAGSVRMAADPSAARVQTFSDRSCEPVMASRSFGATASAFTSLECARTVARHESVGASSPLAAVAPFFFVLPPPPPASSGERSHFLSVLSLEAERRVAGSGAPSAAPAARRPPVLPPNPTAPTASMWPTQRPTHSAVAGSHSLTVASLEADAMRPPPADASRARTMSAWPRSSRQPMSAKSNSRTCSELVPTASCISPPPRPLLPPPWRTT